MRVRVGVRVRVSAAGCLAAELDDVAVDVDHDALLHALVPQHLG